MLVCAIIIMSWFIFLSIVTIYNQFRHEENFMHIIHAVVIISMSILGIIGVACK